MRRVFLFGADRPRKCYAMKILVLQVLHGLSVFAWKRMSMRRRVSDAHTLMHLLISRAIVWMPASKCLTLIVV